MISIDNNFICIIIAIAVIIRISAPETANFQNAAFCTVPTRVHTPFAPVSASLTNLWAE